MLTKPDKCIYQNYKECILKIADLLFNITLKHLLFLVSISLSQPYLIKLKKFRYSFTIHSRYILVCHANIEPLYYRLKNMKSRVNK